VSNQTLNRFIAIGALLLGGLSQLAIPWRGDKKKSTEL
jgi:hypothetical protein